MSEVTRDRVSDAVGLLYDDSRLPRELCLTDALCVMGLIVAALVVIFD